MKVLFLTNNEISQGLIDWLINTANEKVVKLDQDISMDAIDFYKPDFLISYNYRYIIDESVLNVLKGRAINCHISFLPWNKGAYPNIWSFLEDTPKGVTIHMVDKGIDTGDILVQKKVFIDESKETLLSSYVILNRELQNLFIANWGRIKNFNIVPRPQSGNGTAYFLKDFEKIKGLLDKEGWNLQISALKERFKKLSTGGAVNGY